jgi:hypothetical protein
MTVNSWRAGDFIPLPGRPRFLPWQQILAHRALPCLANDLRDLNPAETTDDMDDPWEATQR